jgi:hypothetical protein
LWSLLRCAGEDVERSSPERVDDRGDVARVGEAGDEDAVRSGGT